MKECIIATTNDHKLHEYRTMLEPLGYCVKGLKDLEPMEEIDETGTTFQENALIKAREVAKKFHVSCIADDSGIEIDAFGGQPGIYSARFLGHETPYSEKNAIILDRMKNEKNRACRFACAIAYVHEDGKEKVFFDTIEGEIASVSQGIRGFGYDPIFYVDSLGCTLAEISEEEKNKISHRGKACQQLLRYLNEQ